LELYREETVIYREETVIEPEAPSS